MHMWPSSCYEPQPSDLLYPCRGRSFFCLDIFLIPPPLSSGETRALASPSSGLSSCSVELCSRLEVLAVLVSCSSRCFLPLGRSGVPSVPFQLHF